MNAISRRSNAITTTDLFCGAGGGSLGASLVDDIEIKLAVNHNRLCVQTHNTNFPQADHDCIDLREADPTRYDSTMVLIAGPECDHHTNARGSKRKLQQASLLGDGPELAAVRSRATAWDVVKFTEHHRYEFVIVENVVEFRDWIEYEKWFNAMENLGYKGKALYLNSRFFPPTPQSRDRIYICFWKKQNPKPDLDYRPWAWCDNCEENVQAVQAWKPHRMKAGKLWGKYKTQYIYICPKHSCLGEVTPYYYAAINAIDFGIPIQKIGERSKPLATSTIRRCRAGLEKYGNTPLIITTKYTSGLDTRVKDALQSPLPTQPGGYAHSVLMSAMLMDMAHTKSQDRIVDAFDDPTFTQTSTQSQAIFLANHAFITKAYSGNQAHALSLCDSLGTITSSDHHQLVQLPPFVVEMWGNSSYRGIDKPLSTLTSKQHHAIVEIPPAFLSYYNGNGGNSAMHQPIGTVTSVARLSLAIPDPSSVDINELGFRMLSAPEIGKGMAFPTQDIYPVLGTKEQQVAQYGQAMTPPVIRWLVNQMKGSLNGR